MCGRYTLVETEQLGERFGLEHQSLSPRYNIAPGGVLPVIVQEEANSLKLMKWGLVPFWAKDPSIGNRMINARAESLLSKPSFKRSFQRQRCLVPSSGFYEWQKSSKQPYYFTLNDHQLFAFAGLFDTWKDAEGKTLQSFTIITTSANSVVAPIHNRMPVILDKTQEATWLAEDTKLPTLVDMLKPLSQDKMMTFPVSKEVNAVSNDEASLIRPINSE